MKIRSLTILFALLFFVIGSLWFYSIYKRGQQAWPTGWNYVELMKQKPTTEVQVEVKQSRLGWPMAFHLKKSHMQYFRGIVLMELLGALLYIASAIALLRLYPIGRVLVLLTLLWELWFKLAVIIYQKNVSIPLAKMFNNHNIIFKYFSPSSDWPSAYSVYMSGLDFLGPSGDMLVVYYMTFVFLTFALFSQESFIKTFGR